MGISVPKRVHDQIEAALHRVIWVGIVTGTSGDKVVVVRSGDATGRGYPRLASYTSPEADDEALMLMGIAIGKVVR